MSEYYPVSLALGGRRCLVLGGGVLAHAKVRDLLAAGAQVTLVAPTAVDGLQRLAETETIAWIARDYCPGDLVGVHLAIDASGDDTVNCLAREEATRLGVLLNVVDQADRCDFIAPAIVRRGPLQIAISTSGESPYLASALRARLERAFGEEWAPFVSMVGCIRRRLRAKHLPLADQTAVYRRLISSDILMLLSAGEEGAAWRVAEGIATTGAEGTVGRVSLVGAGPGAPDLITVRGRELLATADLVFHDALIDAALLDVCSADAELVDVGKRAGRCNPDQADITAAMVKAARSGRDVVRLKGGDPFLFGRGGEEMAELVAAGIVVTVVPGVSAAAASLAVAGIPLTMRGVASSVAFVSGHAQNSQADLDGLERVAAAVDTVVVLMPLGTLPAIVCRLASIRGADHPAAIVSNASRAEQLIVRAPLAAIPTASQRSEVVAPATLIVGEVTRPVGARAEERSARTGLGRAAPSWGGPAVPRG
ncbi:MAG: siroheme synthase CysG [Candidatus Dormibacteria bacterium]